MSEIEQSKWDKMFGFVFTQPIHMSLRQMRLIPVGAIVFCLIEFHRLVTWFITTADLETQGNNLIALSLALLGAIWKAVDNIPQVHRHDD